MVEFEVAARKLDKKVGAVVRAQWVCNRRNSLHSLFKWFDFCLRLKTYKKNTWHDLARQLFAQQRVMQVPIRSRARCGFCNMSARICGLPPQTGVAKNRVNLLLRLHLFGLRKENRLLCSPCRIFSANPTHSWNSTDKREPDGNWLTGQRCGRSVFAVQVWTSNVAGPRVILC